MNTLESLTEAATLAAQDLHRLNSEVLTPDNVERIRESVATLTDTLKHIEVGTLIVLCECTPRTVDKRDDI